MSVANAAIEPNVLSLHLDILQDQERGSCTVDKELLRIEIEHTVKDLLRRCDYMTPEATQPNHLLEQACISKATDRGYITSEDGTFSKWLSWGIIMASNAYDHLPDRTTQEYIAIYTGFVMFIEDMFLHDIEMVEQFNHRFITGQPQGHRLLDHAATLLLDIPIHFGTVSGNLIMTSTLNGIAALSVKHEMKGVTLPKSAARFSRFLRYLNAFGEAYALFAFPRDMPLAHYIQAIPDVVRIVNFANDVLSFYKEELGGETSNQIHMTARCHDIHPLVVFHELAGDTAAAHRHILDTLEVHKEAYEAYLAWSRGYIAYHLKAKGRYRLDELGL